MYFEMKLFIAVVALFGISFALEDETTCYQGSLPHFATENQTISVLSGENLTLPCVVKDRGDCVVIWSRDETPLFFDRHKVTSSRRYQFEAKAGFNISIQSATTSDEGNYYCKVNETPLQQAIRLIVNIPPVISLNTAELIHSEVGANITLNCSAEGKPFPQIKWTFSRGKFPMARGNVLNGNILRLWQVDGRYNGEYTCTASNGAGTPQSASVTLSIKFGAMIVSNAFTKVTSGLGQTATLLCAFDGNPEATAIWYNEEEEVIGHGEDPNLQVVVEKGRQEYRSILYIQHMKRSDMGHYYCLVNNTLGQSNATFLLTGLPDAPVIRSKSHADYSYKYICEWNVKSFEKPENYRIHLRTSAVLNVTEAGAWQTLIVTGMKSQPLSSTLPNHYSYKHTFIGLNSSTSYEVKIEAKNSFGWGDLSESFYFDTREDGYTPVPTTKLPIPSSPPTTDGLEYKVQAKSTHNSKGDMAVVRGNFNSAFPLHFSCGLLLLPITILFL